MLQTFADRDQKRPEEEHLYNRYHGAGGRFASAGGPGVVEVTTTGTGRAKDHATPVKDGLTPFDTVAVVKARAKSDKLGDTSSIPDSAKVVYRGKTMTRGEMREQITGDLFREAGAAQRGGEPIEFGKQAFFIIGPPAAGKSGTANPLIKQHRAVLVDADEAKGLIPEFKKSGGDGNLVHEESSSINKNLLKRASDSGANIVIPHVGADHAKTERMVAELQAKGYTVHFQGVHADPRVATQRALDRWKRGETFDGTKIHRFIRPEIVYKVGMNPLGNYSRAKAAAKAGDPIWKKVKFGGMVDSSHGFPPKKMNV